MTTTTWISIYRSDPDGNYIVVGNVLPYSRPWRDQANYLHNRFVELDYDDWRYVMRFHLADEPRTIRIPDATRPGLMKQIQIVWGEVPSRVIDELTIQEMDNG